MSTCRSCGQDNPATAKFCLECGTALVTTCPDCAAPTTPGQKFCGACGRNLGATPAITAAPRESERKQVTVLFADVARSMELAERLDADEWTQLMQRVFAICRDAVTAYGGTVDKFTGDGVMALFGAPIALEDHARRACHAARRIVEGTLALGAETHTGGVGLAVRVGLNSGEVVAGSVGGDTGAYTAVGHTVGLAQRMEAQAEPGTVCLSEHTAALIRGGFELRDLGRVEIKGATLPVGVFALGAPTGESGARRSGSTRLVGRDDELADLVTSLKRAQQSQARVVGIVAEAGSGKSRLCAELSRRAAELGVTVRHTAGVSHAMDVPLLPILGLLRNYFAITEADSPAEVRDKIAARLLALDPDLNSELALVFDFLEVPDPERPAPQLAPEVRRRRVLEVLRRATAKRSEGNTLLLVLEDLHWFDPHSVAFLEGWLPSFPGTRTLVVTNFRPEFHAAWMGRSYYRQLALSPLDDAAVASMLAELLGPDPSLEPVADQLLSRTAGNPFFVEEMVRSLSDDGTLIGFPGAYRLTGSASALRVPATVQAVLAARIDRLDGAHKAVLQSAAVIGRTFNESVLGQVAEQSGDLGAALDALCSAELLQATGQEGEFRFWHPLTQEVAYGSLVTAARRRLHARTAHALIATAADRQDELAALLVTHFDAAQEHLEAARWEIRAGSRAVGTDLAEATGRMHSALRHLAAVPSSAEAVALRVKARAFLLRVGARTGMGLAESDRIFAEGRADAEQLDDPTPLGALVIANGAPHILSGDISGGLSLYIEGCRLADRSLDSDLRAWAWACIGVPFSAVGPVLEALRANDIALGLMHGDPLFHSTHAGYNNQDFAHFVRAMACIVAGRLDEARQLSTLARDGYERRPVADWRCWNLAQFAHLADCSGDPDLVDEAARTAAEAMRIAVDAGSGIGQVTALQATGLAALLAGRTGEAVASLEDALARTRAQGIGWHEVGVLAHLARAHLARGDGPAAQKNAEDSVAVARRQGARVYECLGQLVRARVWRETAAGATDLAEARSALQAADALATETGAGTYAAFIAEERFRLDGGDLAAVAAGYETIGASGHAARIRAELA